MKLDKNAIKEIENKVTEYALTIYDSCRIKHITADKAGREKVYVFLECMVESKDGEWINRNFLGIATSDGYLDIYECIFETTDIFDVEGA